MPRSSLPSPTPNGSPSPGSWPGTGGLTREAYALDLRQFTTWCCARSLALCAIRRADIESFARELGARARATLTRRLYTIAGFYTDTVIAHVSEDAADIAFIEGPRRPAGLRSRVIGHDRLVVVVAPGHPWARRRRGVGAAELASTPLAGREGGSGTRDTLSAALAAAHGPGTAQVPAALSLSTTAAVRAAVLAGAAPAVISELAVAGDLAAGRLIEIPAPDLDLCRTLHTIWDGTKNPPAGPARDLIAHILGRRPAPPRQPRNPPTR